MPKNKTNILAVFPIIILIFIKSSYLFAQHNNVQFTAVSTGATTGHLADLMVNNNTAIELNTTLGPFFIPSDGKYQPYITVTPIKVIVRPNETMTYPIMGYCVDIHRPPISNGKFLPKFEEWITPSTLPNYWNPSPSKGWTPSTIDNYLIPGTEVSLKSAINVDKYPQEAANVLFTAIQKISLAFESLKNIGSLETVLSSKPENEKEGVLQQTFWIYTSLIQGKAYEKEEFIAKMKEQINNKSNNSIKSLTLEESVNLEKGLDDLWSSFQQVGTLAKLFK